jgi:hypothetical protein
MAGKITLNSAGSVPGNPDAGWISMYPKSDGRMYSKNSDGTEYMLGIPAGGFVETVNGATGTVVLTTTNISEGTNLYYTDGRVDSRVATLLTDYAKLTGRSGGQILYGGTAASEALELYSTSHATKGIVRLGQNYKEFATGVISVGQDNTYTPVSGVNVALRTSSSGAIAFEHSSGQPWLVYPTIGNLQFSRYPATTIGFALDTSNRFFVGDGSPQTIACISGPGDSTTAVGAFGATTTPNLEIRNRNSTANNYSGVVFSGSGTSWGAGVFGIHEVHTAGAQTTRLEMYTSSAGTRAKIASLRNTGFTHEKAVSYPDRTLTTAYTITDDDYAIWGNASGGAFSVTLPTAVGRRGKVFVIKKIDASVNAVTIDGDGSETIDNATTKQLTSENEVLWIMSDNSNWRVI